MLSIAEETDLFQNTSYTPKDDTPNSPFGAYPLFLVAIELKKNAVD